MGPSYVPSKITHFFTVDVEDYFQVGAFEHLISRDTWPSYAGRVERNVDRLLALLARAGATGTFFTLGWIAERYPDLVRRIAREGHEIASHGMWHRGVDTLTITAFREDVRASKALLEDVTGAAVVGFRAPNFSLRTGAEWAYDVLGEEGYEYDSSRFPMRNRDARTPSIPQYAHAVSSTSGRVLEVPMTTLDIGGVLVPAAGGACVRHFPYGFIRRAFRESERVGVPGVFYVHPWELDPEQPRLAGPLLLRARHYRGLRKTEPRITRLLREFRFSAIAHGLSELTAQAPVVYV